MQPHAVSDLRNRDGLTLTVTEDPPTVPYEQISISDAATDTPLPSWDPPVYTILGNDDTSSAYVGRSQRRRTTLEYSGITQRAVRRGAASSSLSSGSRNGIRGEVELAAIEARRTDQETGITWIEVEYRPRNPLAGTYYVFQNIVSGTL